MIEVYAQVEDEDLFHRKDVEKVVTQALKATSKWLARESVKRIGRKLRIKTQAGKRRVKINKVNKNTGGVWYGLLPISLAYAREYKQTPTGVLSGDRFYKGAFAQAVSGSRELIWERERERPKRSTRAKRSPNGTRRKRKSPPVRLVREDVHDETVEVVGQLEHEVQEVYKEAFLHGLNALTH
ncbi:hypothetical protein G6Z94_11840 [Vibrio aestuarianus]|uniref:hypothetical protein n=1 Tax=Vibrio aestuarianus TaxID=28171 RepID=UPI001592B4F8|nr:hypothetical protein [Vibrio aestuarianus]NGZ18031.1 hypothetical protein [Vibrio aestuarianus]